MSDVQNTPAPVTEASEATATTPAVNTDTTAPVASESKPETTTETPAATTTTEEATPAAAATTAEETKEEKTVEPIIEGQLAYKGPGLVKSLIPSKKEFWLNDDALSPSNLDLYLRGEKPDVANSVVAWASQTGKGLLFFNKKGETDRSHPADVLALYEATDLKKQSPHEFSFKINGHNHTFKATNDAERDGWYQSIEKAVELGKASKEEVHNSEGYKAELEKLNKPSTFAGAAVRSHSKPKKSTDAADKTAERTGSAEDDEVEKKQKSRSTSRGMLNRLKGKKEELGEKKEEKKEEKEAEKEEKKAEETGPVSDSTEAAPVLAGAAALETPAAAETAAAEPAVETPAAEEKAEKSKPAKRGSIFGRVSSGWSGLKSPAKEKEAKDAELKAEPKDAAVSENPPVLPETATTEPALETPAVAAVEEPTEAKPEAPKEETATPSKEKSNFLSGLGFMKRNRSVSPSTQMKQEPAKKETEETPAEAVKTEEPVTEGAAVENEADKPVEKAEEPAKTETPNKRQSVLGSLGRRASKALNRMQAPKKSEPTAAASTEAKKEETTEGGKAAEETPVVNGETKQTDEEAQKSIGDVVPDAVNVGQPQAQQSAPTVTASA